MSKKSFEGEITADVIEVRFAFSGKVVSVRKKAGDKVNKWETIASLDRKGLQTELDRQLADYEKARADFELFRIKYPEGGDDSTKFLRQEAQAQLNASVKEVELAKYKLDQADLVSPVTGAIVDLGGLVAGLYVTPGSYPVKVVDSESYTLRFTVGQDELEMFLEPVEVKVKVSGVKKEFSGTSRVPLFGKSGRFEISVPLSDSAGLIAGMKGVATLKTKS